MKKSSILFVTLFLLGCATVQLQTDYKFDKTQNKSVVFGKADFQNLKDIGTRITWAQIILEDVMDKRKRYQFFVGNRGLFAMQRLQPEYFFIELPAGEYKIVSIGTYCGIDIDQPVGNIFFSVEPGSVVYTGTLKLTNIKDKTRFGGLPLMKFGFTYTAEISDEREKAFKELQKKYPLIKEDIKVSLMKEELSAKQK